MHLNILTELDDLKASVKALIDHFEKEARLDEANLNAYGLAKVELTQILQQTRTRYHLGLQQLADLRQLQSDIEHIKCYGHTLMGTKQHQGIVLEDLRSIEDVLMNQIVILHTCSFTDEQVAHSVGARLTEWLTCNQRAQDQLVESVRSCEARFWDIVHILENLGDLNSDKQISASLSLNIPAVHLPLQSLRGLLGDYIEQTCLADSDLFNSPLRSGRHDGLEGFFELRRDLLGLMARFRSHLCELAFDLALYRPENIDELRSHCEQSWSGLLANFTSQIQAARNEGSLPPYIMSFAKLNLQNFDTPNLMIRELLHQNIISSESPLALTNAEWLSPPAELTWSGPKYTNGQLRLGPRALSEPQNYADLTVGRTMLNYNL